MSPAAPIQAPIYCFDVMFDPQVDPERWARQLAALYVTHVEFHSYMPAHERVDLPGESWNSYAGDARLWTSRATLHQKIAALHKWGIHAILYAACYAATPAFYARYPQWAAYAADGRPVLFPEIHPPYLVLQAMRRDAHAPATVDGVEYSNYRAYVLAQLRQGLADYGFDGVRMDFYGIPTSYTSPSFAGEANMSADLVDFMGELSQTLKRDNPATEIMVIELPHVDGDQIRLGVGPHVDARWLELWPQAEMTGVATYADIIREINVTRELTPGKPVIASFYPQNPPHSAWPELPAGWSIPNLHLNYATVFAAGGSWGGHSVDGLGSFTQVLPFKFTYMDEAQLAVGQAWNGFMRRYGPAYVWENELYRYAVDEVPIGLEPGTPAVRALLYQRQRVADQGMEALVLHLVHYGANTEWALVAEAPPPLAHMTLAIPVPPGHIVHRLLYGAPGQDLHPLAFQQVGNRLTFELPGLAYYAMIVAELTAADTLPPALTPAPALEPYRPEPFDIEGTALWSQAETITLFDEAPLFAVSPYDPRQTALVAATYSLTSSNAYRGTHAYEISGGVVKFTAAQQQAIRFAAQRFRHLTFAWQGAEGLTLGLELVNSETGEVQTLTFAAGTERGNVWLGPAPITWQVVKRDVWQDVQDTIWGRTWRRAAVSALYLGAQGTGWFDAITVAINSTP